jgi:hypothetical protein
VGVGCQALERLEVSIPGIDAAELVVENSAGCMNMRLPSMPFRTATDHTVCTFLRRVVLLRRP